MDLLRLAAKIELDDSSYVKGVNNAEKLGQNLAGKMSAWTVAVGNLAADMVKRGIGAINNVVKGAVNGYADYQQLIGGVETLFKNSSDKVAAYAKKSFKSTGLSANDYMETVTSFSASLIQGLGGDTAKAADMANMAVTDMADNANKMGTDMSAIQNAYQGFAKQNFTMLDNLKLGYGGTREEMVRLINDAGILDHEIKNLDGITFDQLVQAIHVIQENLGITGTTAKEAADTISGSKASLKAAWEDLLSAVGGEGGEDRLNETMENFKTSFTTYMQNFIPTLATTITNSGSLVEAVAESIASLPTDLLSQLGERGLESGTQMVNSVSNITSWLIDSITNLFKSASANPESIKDFGAAIGDFIGTAIKDIAVNAPALVTGIFDTGVALAGGLIEGLFSGLFGPEGLPEQMEQIDSEMTDSIKAASQNATKAQGILNYMDDLVKKYGDATKETKEYKDAMAQLNTVMEVPEWITNTNSGLQTQIDLLKQSAAEMEKQAIAAAKQKALQDKEQAVIEAQGALWQAQSDIAINKSIRDEAARNLLEFFGLKGATSRETGEAIDQGFDYTANAQQIYESLIRRVDEATGGAGNQAYQDMMDKLSDPANKGQVMAWIESMSESNQTMATLEGTVSSLESQLQKAASDYALSSAAVDNLAASASQAASALSSIQAPSINLPSGAYYNWYYGSGHGHATGIDYVPYSGYRAELHEGEAVLTKRENQERRQRSDYEITALEDALVSALEKVGVYMGPEKVGDLTTKRTRANINNESRSRQRAYGG